jgi:MFS superfamily sulfate permease-like transporter
VTLRLDAPLFFANADIFHEHVLQAVAEAPTPTKWVVVAAEPVTDIDITAADALSELDDELQRAGAGAPPTISKHTSSNQALDFFFPGRRNRGCLTRRAFVAPQPHPKQCGGANQQQRG